MSNILFYLENGALSSILSISIAEMRTLYKYLLPFYVGTHLSLLEAPPLAKLLTHSYRELQGFPDGSVVKNLPANARETRGFDICVQKIAWRRKCQPTPVFLSGKSQRHAGSLISLDFWGQKCVITIKRKLWIKKKMLKILGLLLSHYHWECLSNTLRI